MKRLKPAVEIQSGICLLLLWVLFTGCAAAQTCNPGEVRVLVRDSQESPVFDAKVVLASAAAAGSPAKEVLSVQTPTTGLADLLPAPCGSWTVRASKAGFDDSTATVEITSGSEIEIGLVLNPQMNRSSVDVTDTPPPVEQSSSQNYELKPAEVKSLPTNPATVSDALPLVPGVVRAANGELKLDGAGEQRSSLVVNQSDVTDPATAKFGQTVPVDSIETMNVLNTPFLAQYGRFTQTVVAVETRRGGEKWHADLNDPFPDFRIRSYHMVGIRNETPRFVVDGPLIHNRLYFISALQYFLDKTPNRTLPFPRNESKQERVNSFTQLDYIVSQRQLVNFTLHYSPEHINFVGPDFFNPQPVTPSYAQKTYSATLADHYGLLGGTLDTSLSYQRFHTFIGSQGTGAEIVQPQGNSGNYFGTQSRDAFRREWLEVWSLAPMSVLGTHQVKVGSSLTVANDRGVYDYRPVNILSAAGLPVESITFSNPGPYKRTDLEFTLYGQDHWIPFAQLAFDAGVRVEHQREADSLRIAPRAGMAYTPFSDGKTVLRMGFGQFYDHIPLNVYSFSRYPNRTVTMYAPDGSIIGTPTEFTNVIGSVTGPRSFLVHGERVAGAFSPRGLTWNAQVEHSFSPFFKLRAVYTDNRSVGLIVLEPDILGAASETVLNGDGSSRYRQAEITARVNWPQGQQLVLSYVHSRAEGSLNVFDNYVGNFATPYIRPDVYSSLPGDIPNRFLLWGHIDTHFWKLKAAPIFEYRNGFPYAVVNALQNYVGIPYSDSTRFRNFFSADTRIMRDFKISAKYTVRLSLTGFNLTNHFNPLAVHDNVADPQYGVFFGNYHRRYRFDFDFLF
jgi:hypothetical protein